MNRWYRWAKLVGVVLVALVTGGCGSSAPPVEPAFDIPALVGKDVKGVLQTLGAATQFSDPATTPRSVGLTEWDISWEKGTATLMVTYDLRNLRVIDFFISESTPDGTTDIERAMQLGSLKDGDPRYTVVPVQAAGKPGKYTGLKVMPK